MPKFWRKAQRHKCLNANAMKCVGKVSASLLQITADYTPRNCALSKCKAKQ
uniref:Uncharacterized protein n=1 Tax=Rhizophora mucronata TaxID=61149 RepID=A0A2P2NAL3_RHIMU